MLLLLLLTTWLSFLNVICADSTSEVPADEVTKLAQSHRKAVRTSLFESTWPSDHGDISRSKYTLNAGLPADFKADELKTILQRSTPQAQWYLCCRLFIINCVKFILLLAGFTRTAMNLSISL